MEKKTLKNFKDAVKPFIRLVELYKKLAPQDNLLTCISVCLNNICFDWENSKDYTLEKDIEEVNNYLAFLSYLKEVEKNYHFVCYLIEQIEFIHTAYIMEEEYEREAKEEQQEEFFEQ